MVTIDSYKNEKTKNKEAFMFFPQKHLKRQVLSLKELE